MKYNIIKENTQKPCIYFKENVVNCISNEFEILTGFSINDLIGKSITEITKLLKADSQVQLQEIENEFSCYIFSKDNCPREVKIYCNKNIEKNEYTIYFNEIKSSRIEDSFPYLTNILPDDDIAVAVYGSPTGVLLKANEKYINYLNYLCCNESNKIGKSLNEFIPNYKGSRYETHFNTVIKTGIPKYFINHNDYAYHEGNIYWDGSLVPVYRQGEIKHVVHTGIDVTERVISRNIIEKQKNELKKQKEELEEKRQELEAIIENISDEVITFDNDGNFSFINKITRDNEICDSYTTKNIVDFSNLNILYDMDGNLIPLENTLTKRVIRGEKINNVKVIRKRGNLNQIREVNGTPIYDAEGNFKLGVLISRDINERLKKEENIFLKTQYETLYNIINNLDLGFARLTYPDNKIIDINNEAFSILKKIVPHIKTQQSIINQRLTDIIKQDINIKDNIFDTMNNNKGSYYIIKKYIFDGNEEFYKYIFQPLYGLNKEILEVIIIVLDISEDEKNKNKLEDAIKIQDELYMNVSHELRTPLNVISSANQFMDILLECNSIDREKLISYNNMIKQNCFRLTKIINNVIDLSKSNSGFLKATLSNENIVEIVRSIVQSVSEYDMLKKFSIKFQSNVEEKIIACDSYMIERVMLNLISNAIKFSKPCSDINVEIENKDNTVEIHVTDIGIGIDDKKLKNLFTKYYQADKSLSRMAEGSGIGLALVKTIVELHHGHIKAESEIGMGSTFIVELPSKIVDNQSEIRSYKNENKIEMMKIEFSDIYSKD